LSEYISRDTTRRLLINVLDIPLPTGEWVALCSSTRYTRLRPFMFFLRLLCALEQAAVDGEKVVFYYASSQNSFDPHLVRCRFPQYSDRIQAISPTCKPVHRLGDRGLKVCFADSWSSIKECELNSLAERCDVCLVWTLDKGEMSIEMREQNRPVVIKQYDEVYCT
jgi:hypothetical protein